MADFGAEVETFRAEARDAYQRREANRERRLIAGRRGQQFAITPEIVGPAFDHAARQNRADFGIVVVDFEWSETGLANMQRADRIFLAAFTAFQICNVAHRILVYLAAGNSAEACG